MAIVSILLNKQVQLDMKMKESYDLLQKSCASREKESAEILFTAHPQILTFRPLTCNMSGKMKEFNFLLYGRCDKCTCPALNKKFENHY